MLYLANCTVSIKYISHLIEWLCFIDHYDATTVIGFQNDVCRNVFIIQRRQQLLPKCCNAILVQLHNEFQGLTLWIFKCLNFLSHADFTKLFNFSDTKTPKNFL